MSFADEFNARVRGRDNYTLARVCNVSVPTISRWRVGFSEPHELARAAILKALDK